MESEAFGLVQVFNLRIVTRGQTAQLKPRAVHAELFLQGLVQTIFQLRLLAGQVLLAEDLGLVTLHRLHGSEDAVFLRNYVAKD